MCRVQVQVPYRPLSFSVIPVPVAVRAGSFLQISAPGACAFRRDQIISTTARKPHLNY